MQTPSFQDFELGEGKITSLQDFHLMHSRAQDRVASNLTSDIEALLKQVQKASGGAAKDLKQAAVLLTKVLQKNYGA